MSPGGRPRRPRSRPRHPSRPGGSGLATDARGVTPAVSKALEAAIVVLFVAAMTTSLYGGMIPAYRTAVGAEVAERTVAEAALRVEAAVPPPAREVRVVHRVDLPAAIRGAGYSVHARDGALVLDHPDDRIDARTPLVLPERIARVTGRWDSGADTAVVVRGGVDGLEIRLTDRAGVAGVADVADRQRVADGGVP